eukprot:TRINITY_DN12081_c0_g1_i1.p1 TRINITY_DN12081_c0_g1~~TRINITY_DN12081_c0_g1_i1.p1  ORF type:complete len:348 (-),score=88.26 TRINITY_DN12081_c0_g1_i1:334-1377(-)
MSLEGCFYLAMSAFFFSVMSLAAKVLVQHEVPVGQLLLFRSLFQFFGSMLGITIQHLQSNQWRLIQSSDQSSRCDRLLFIVNLYIGPPEVRFKCILRGLAGFCSLAFLYYSLEFLTLSDASTLVFTAPIWTGIFAKFFLKETFGKWHVVACIVAVTGAVCISKPSFAGEEHELGSILALAGAVFTAASYTIIKSLNSKADSFILSGYFGAISTILSIPLLYATDSFAVTHQEYWVWVFLFVAGWGSLIGQTFLNMGLNREKAGAAAMIRNLDVVFAFVFELGVLGHTPNITSLIGALLVCGAAVSVGLLSADEQQKAAVEMEDLSDRKRMFLELPRLEDTLVEVQEA